MKPASTRSSINRRSLLTTGVKLAYVTPVVVALAKVDPAFAGASGGPPTITPGGGSVTPPGGNPPGGNPPGGNPPGGNPPGGNPPGPSGPNTSLVVNPPGNTAALPAANPPVVGAAPPNIEVGAVQPATPTPNSPISAEAGPPVATVPPIVVSAQRPVGAGSGASGGSGVQRGATEPMPSTMPVLPNTGTGGLAEEEERR
jgi:hypothetical protein